MWELGPQEIFSWFASHIQFASWLALLLASVSTFILGVLPQDQRDSVALMMMGAGSNENWASSFTKWFDAAFGRQHLGLRCILRSTFVSLLAVFLLWISFGTIDGITNRLTSVGVLWQVLVVGLIVNALADYVSLLETRLLLGWLTRSRPVWLQALVLLADLLISAAIIWSVLWVTQAFGVISFVLGSESDGLAEVVGLFSPLSVFFYSTFITSIWTWVFILSCWLLRAVAGVRWLHSSYAEHPRTMMVSALCVSIFLIGFIGSATLSALTTPDQQNLSYVDRTLCSFAQGEVCLHVRSLTEDETTRLALTLDACRGGVTEECLKRGFEQYQADPVITAQYWRVACESGDFQGCNGLGFLNQRGIGLETDLEEAARLFRQACDGGNLQGCTGLGVLHRDGLGMDADPEDAARLFRQACDGGELLGCTSLGFLHQNGLGMDADPSEAARLYRQACDGGQVQGCTNLGVLYGKGISNTANQVEATRLFRQACDGGNLRGCTGLGLLYEGGLVIDGNPVEAAKLYRQGCDDRNANDCTKLGLLHETGAGGQADPAKAARLYQQGCEGGDELGCTHIERLMDIGLAIELDRLDSGSE